MMTARASSLKEGIVFKVNPKGRKVFTVKKVVQLSSDGNIPTEHKGKLLVILSDCRQMVLAPDEQVLIRN